MNIIGFNVDQKGEDQLKAVAEAGNGKYISTDNSIAEKWFITSMTDVVYIKHSGPNGFTVGNAKYSIGQLSMKLSNAVNIESSHFRGIIQLLITEEWITSEQGEELTKKVNQKTDQVDDEYNRIHQNIDAWVKEVEKIRSDQ
ncbi:hypothetical protein [Psychrobacillus sp. NPDC096623]|uniref:hypothetical protein n=1 Tax=Psychrobacillus sp. NPDC096623 TaxID=3364492 RepID=UPI003800115A